jgi:hypothetical protein
VISYRSGVILPPNTQIYVLHLPLYIIFAQKESHSIAFTSIFLLQLGVDAMKSLQPCLHQGRRRAKQGGGVLNNQGQEQQDISSHFCKDCKKPLEIEACKRYNSSVWPL